MKFEVGDLVKSIHGEAKVVRVGFSNSEGPYCYVVTTKSSKEGYYPNGHEYAIYVRFLTSVSPELPKEKQVEIKINQLYERQAWVKEGKQSALFYIKPPVPSAGEKATTEPETISGFTPMDMNTASDADLPREGESYGQWLDRLHPARLHVQPGRP